MLLTRITIKLKNFLCKTKLAHFRENYKATIPGSSATSFFPNENWGINFNFLLPLLV